MRTFKLTLGLDFKAVVPEEFTKEMRAMVHDPMLSSPFLRKANEQAGDDDEAFTLAVLKNGVRRIVRNTLMDEMHRAGIGGSFSPASIAPVDTPVLAD